MTTTSRRATFVAGLFAAGLGCNAGSGGDGFDFSTDSNGPGGGTMTAASTGASDTGGSDTSAPPPTTDTTAAEGSSSGDGESSTTDELPPSVPCTGVDILFVVDNSQPMLEEQIRLRSSALAFVQQVQSSIPTLTDDIHVAVITTDDETFVQSDAKDCSAYEGGNSWMLGSSKNLGPELECALNVGVAGSPNERPMQMLSAAFADELVEPGALHNGFLRESALLVVVLATNEEDEIEADTRWGSPGDPADWAESLANLKGGWSNDVVVLSLLGLEKPNACVGPWNGTEGAQYSPRLIEFTESFPIGTVSDICEQEYASFLLGVVPGVAAACDGYIPP